MFNLEKRIRKWQYETFGAPDMTYALVERMEKETRELIDHYDSLSDDEIAEECADIHHMLIAICGDLGRSLNAETRRKFKINLRRNWHVLAPGIGQHKEPGEIQDDLFPDERPGAWSAGYWSKTRKVNSHD